MTENAEQPPHQHHHHHSVITRRRRIKFWTIAVVLCFLAALVAVGVKVLVDTVGASKHTRYEPVDVPPVEVSPRHEREREEYQRRDKAVREKAKP
jgi:hypothetical protein